MLPTVQFSPSVSRIVIVLIASVLTHQEKEFKATASVGAEPPGIPASVNIPLWRLVFP